MKNMLTNVREDMSVFDRTGDKIGTVKSVHFGDENLEQPGVETTTAQTPEVRGNDLVQDFRQAISFEDRFPPEIRERMQRYGYIEIDTGILGSDHYVRSDQIAQVDDDRVELNAALDDLLKA